MYNYEVTPPDGVWDKVAAALDEAFSEDKFPTTLYNMEVAPPASSWDEINTSLYGKDEKVIPLKRRTATFFRYAAAAVVIGIIAFGVSIWNSNQESNTDTIQAINLTDTNSIKTETPSIATEKQEPANEIAYEDNVEKNPVKTVSTKTNRNKSADKEIINPLYTYEDHAADIADRYIMLMTPDGNIIRMSKKWGDMVCCVSGEEQDEDCKNQIKAWQKKLATSPATTSPGNFMDILELVSSLEEGIDL